MIRPRWLFALAAATFALGLAGFTGSSWWHGARFSRLYDQETRFGLHEVVGISRGIRSDEWSIELPSQRAQQLQGYGRADLLPGLGQLSRSTAEVPVLDWGLAFRPLLWPLVWNSPRSFALRWSFRSAVALLALFFFLRAMAVRAGLPAAEERARVTIAALGEVAVAYSSAWQWWLSGGFVEIVALGLLAAAVGAFWLSSRRKIAALAFALLAPCAFFHFYPPLWGPLLLVLCAALADQARRSGKLARAVPLIAGLGAGAALSIAYFSAYLASVLQTIYPGQRIAEAGLLPAGRLLDLLWPSLSIAAPFGSFEQYLGPESTNVCEGSAVEALPLFLVALAVVSPRLREALRRVLRASPFSLFVWLIFAAWLLLPLPQLFTRLAFLQFTPWFRLWFLFGLSSALLATQLLAELCAEDLPPLRYEFFAAVVFLGWAFFLGYLRAPGNDLSPLQQLGHQIPLLLAFGLSLFGVLRLGKRRGPLLLGLAWALPLVLANLSVNPLVEASDLFQRGPGHQAIDRALQAAPAGFSTTRPTAPTACWAMAGRSWPRRRLRPTAGSSASSRPRRPGSSARSTIASRTSRSCGRPCPPGWSSTTRCRWPSRPAAPGWRRSSSTTSWQRRAHGCPTRAPKASRSPAPAICSSGRGACRSAR